MVWNEIVWFQIMNLMVWAESGVGQSAVWTASDWPAGIMGIQTPQKLLAFYRTEEGFWSDFADFKHDYTQEFYQSCSFFISKCPRAGKFRGFWGSIVLLFL